MVTRKQTAFSFALSAALSAAPFLLSDVRYMTPDDYLIHYIANGSYGNAYREMLVYLSPAAGLLLRCLYTAVPGVNWLPVSELAVIVLCFGILHGAVLSMDRHRGLLFVTGALNFSVPMFFLSFTVVGFLACGTGFFLLLYTFAGNVPCRPFVTGTGAGSRPEHTNASLALAGVLLIIGASFRKDALLPAGAVFAACLIPPAAELAGSRRVRRLLMRKIRKKVPVLTLLFGAALAAAGINRAMWSRPGWTEYRRYTNARSSAVDWPPVSYRENESAFREAGISANDYVMLVNWRMADRGVFTEKTLRAAGNIEKSGMTLRRRGKYLVSCMTLSNAALLLLPLFAFLIFRLMIAGGRGGSGRARPAASGSPRVRCAPALPALAAGYGILASLAFIRMRFVAHVTVPLVFLMIMAQILLLIMEEGVPDARSGKTGKSRRGAGVPTGRPDRSEYLRGREGTAGKPSGNRRSTGIQTRRAMARKAAAAALCTAMLLCALCFLQTFERELGTASSEEKAAAEAVRRETASHPDTLYIFDGGLLTRFFYTGEPVSEVKRTDIFRNVARAGSWDSFSPRYRAQISRFISDPDRLLTSLLTERNTAYVTEDDSGMEQFLREHAGGNFTVSVRRIDGVSAGVYTYSAAAEHADPETAEHADPETAEHADSETAEHADPETEEYADPETTEHNDSETADFTTAG